MHTHNEILVRAPFARCLQVAADVERWPEILPHYRKVEFTRRDGFGQGRVRMSAYRHFGPLPYPTWWESEMVTDAERATIRYRHVAGITRGMDVLWDLEEVADGVRIVILHDWEGPAWPGIGDFAARRVIGPHFIRVVADRTLAGVRREAERAPGSTADPLPPGSGAEPGSGGMTGNPAASRIAEAGAGE